MKYVQAFIRGMIEFRSDVTWGSDDLEIMEWYDAGRDLSHRLTFRHWDH